MPRPEAQTRKLFDGWAQSYDTDLESAQGPLIGYQQSVAAIADAIPAIAEGTHILDIGSGSGRIAAQFAQRGATITGIDLSQKMLDVCAEKFPDFTLHIGTFNRIPADDAAFDAVVSGFAFHEVPTDDRLAACQEMARVLKPEGYLCLLDIMFPSPRAMRDAAELVGRAWDHSEDYAKIGNLDTWLREADFASISWQQTAPFHWMVTARK